MLSSDAVASPRWLRCGRALGGGRLAPGVMPEAEVGTVKKTLRLGALLALLAGLGKFIMGRRHGDEEDA